MPAQCLPGKGKMGSGPYSPGVLRLAHFLGSRVAPRQQSKGWQRTSPNEPRPEHNRGSAHPKKPCSRPMWVSHQGNPIEGGTEPSEPSERFRDPPRLPSGILEHAYPSQPLTNGSRASTWTNPLVTHRERHCSPTKGSMMPPTPPSCEKGERGVFQKSRNP
jgi:hypothetical protein